MKVREYKERAAALRTMQALLAKLREMDEDLTSAETIRKSFEFVRARAEGIARQ